jgi:hypothetical protein
MSSDGWIAVRRAPVAPVCDVSELGEREHCGDASERGKCH